MEKAIFKNHLKSSMEALEDLYSLGDPSLYPLLDRLHFYMNEISETHSDETRLSSFKGLNNLFMNKIQGLVDDFYRSKPGAVQVDYCNALHNPNFKSLDKIISTFPHAVEVSDLFQFQGKLKIELENDSFHFSGHVPLSLDFESLRESCYLLTRAFLKKNVLFTFQVLETSSEDTFKMSFSFHFDTGEKPYVLNIDKEKSLALPSVISKFIVPMSSLKQLGEHRCYFLDADLNVKEVVADSIGRESLRHEGILFHFPFLFRPLSLIIKSSPEKDFRDELLTRNIEEECPRPFILDVDLFKILQK